MPKVSAQMPEHRRYRARLQLLIDRPLTSPATSDLTPEAQAHWAKYLCVLVSGYLEQAVREILITHTNSRSAPTVQRYVEESWPGSKNMRCDAISKILGQFDSSWAAKFETWLAQGDERKGSINLLIRWRNDIAHGKERDTTGVTISSVRSNFQVAKDVVDLLEGLAA
jgi:hypothetical protein